ncbi:MAG: ABC transporter permease [Endomicrobiales bacterium]|nr:ABC transporter permease [Endomicrobiales bacterium]
MIPLELFIAWRYIKARRRGVFTLLTTLIAIGGITLGVAALIITLSVMSGFHKDIKEKILGLQPHLVVLKHNLEPFSEYNAILQIIKDNKEVNTTSPFIYGQILLRSKHQTTGAVLKGIEWSEEIKLTKIDKLIKESDIQFDGLKDNEIILGNELAQNLRVNAGQDVILMSPGQMNLVPVMRKFKVAALFHSGMYEYDTNLAYITLKSAQQFFDMGDSITGLGVSIKNFEKAEKLESFFKTRLSFPYSVRSWQSMNHNLFAALKLEKIMMFIILTLIILVAAFNIISNLILLTVEKAKEIGILSAIGLKRYTISKIFFYEGIIIGFSGIFLGVLLGIVISLLLKNYQFIQLPPDIYYLDTLPVRILYGDVLSVILATILITLLSVIYPAYQSTKTDPLETIRYG